MNLLHKILVNLN